MKVLIIGGSGILSTDFTKKILDAGDEAYVLNRGRRTHFIDERSKLITADIRNESIESLRNKIKNNTYDVVVDFLSYNTNQLKKTLNVIEKLYKQYIFISSATVYNKNSENDIITEAIPIGNKKWDYAYNKVLCEEFLRNCDINYTIIRPYVTYSNSRIPFPIISDSYQFTLLARILQDKPVLLYENGNAICTLTNTVDFAEILYRILLNENSYGEAFHITGPFVQTWKDVYNEMCKLLNKAPNYVSVNIEDIEKYMPGFKYILLGDKGTNMQFDSSKVMSIIGDYEFQYDLTKGLRESIDFYLNNDYMQGLDYKWDGECDYVIYNKDGRKLKPLKNYQDRNNKSKIYYYIMRYQPFRGMYDFARWIKKKAQL